MDNQLDSNKGHSEKQEKINEELLLDMLKNCEPLIMPGTIMLHRDKLLSLIEKNRLDITNLTDNLTEISALRAKIDQEDARTNKTKFSEIIYALTVVIDRVNKLANYDLISAPKLVYDYRFQIYILMENLSKSGYNKNITDRAKKELTSYIYRKSQTAYQHTNDFLKSLVDKLKNVNTSFASDNIIPFTNKFSNEFDIELH